jgi:hypothetical protein
MQTADALQNQFGSGTIFKNERVHVCFSVHSGTQDGKSTPLAGISVSFNLPIVAMSDKPSENSVVVEEAGERVVKYLHPNGSHSGVTSWGRAREILLPHLPDKVVEFCDRMAPLIDQVMSELRPTSER